MSKNTIQTKRQAGEHLFVPCGGVPRCATCGCDEDDAFIGGEECTFGRNEIAEQQRRDEKNGLYSEQVDSAN